VYVQTIIADPAILAQRRPNLPDSLLDLFFRRRLIKIFSSTCVGPSHLISTQAQQSSSHHVSLGWSLCSGFKQSGVRGLDLEASHLRRHAGHRYSRSPLRSRPGGIRLAAGAGVVRITQNHRMWIARCGIMNRRTDNKYHPWKVIRGML
jgi:hypothetical protein